MSNAASFYQLVGLLGAGVFHKTSSRDHLSYVPKSAEKKTMQEYKHGEPIATQTVLADHTRFMQNLVVSIDFL